MTDNLIFNVNSSFKAVSYDKDSDSWSFSFEDNISVLTSGFWRILENNSIVLVSMDHEQQFGLDKPLDLVEELTRILTGKSLSEIKVNKDTADLVLFFGKNIKIEILIASSGYETYQFSINSKKYIGLGSGEIAISDMN